MEEVKEIYPKSECIYRSRAIIGNLRNAASDVLDPWNIKYRPRSQYMHRFRSQYKKIIDLLDHWNFKSLDQEALRFLEIITGLKTYFKTSPKTTKENSIEFSKGLLDLLKDYGIEGNRPREKTTL